MFSLVASFTTYLLARSRGEISRLHLVLSGIVISAFFSALVSILKFLVDPHKLVSIVYWLLGSFSLSDWSSIWIASLGMIVACAPLMLMRWRLNALSMGEEEARSLGIPVERDRLIFIGAASLAVGSAVSVSGISAGLGDGAPPDQNADRAGPQASHALFLRGRRCLHDFCRHDCQKSHLFNIPVGIITSLSGTPFHLSFEKRHRGELGQMIEVRELTFMHQGAKEPVLRKIDFLAKGGEVTAILGPNGSGKTTLFQCLLGIWKFQEGEVRLSGKPITISIGPRSPKGCPLFPRSTTLRFLTLVWISFSWGGRRTSEFFHHHPYRTGIYPGRP